ncbi:MAG: glycosyltransferase [Spirochaetales bacterium]|nr:glycosyltransferase [Spirochaetales bacterium]
MAAERKTSPLVSVIIPTFNRLAFLEEAVKSVENQTSRDWELIIVDDGSNDGTIEYARATGHTLISRRHSGRPGLLRNIGIRAAKGAYVAFLDSDDLWKPEKCGKQLSFFSSHPHSVICHTREIWLRNGNIISQKGQTHKRSGRIFGDALKKCIIGPSTVMINREALIREGMFHEDIEIAEDYELWLRITTHHEVGYIDEPLVIKRGGHPDQLSEKYGHIEYFRIRALRIFLDTARISDEQRRLAEKELSRKCRIYARGCRKRGKHDEYEYYIGLAGTIENKKRLPS